MNDKKLYGGIEAGGTKFVCGIGTGGGELLRRVEIPTTSPDRTLQKVLEFFSAQKKLSRIGIGSFGPLQLKQNSDDFGSILQTTKPGWLNVNIPEVVHRNLKLPVSIVTDTDVATIGEQHHGKAVNIENFAYLTIGTGIGGSVVVNGKLVHGITHPEIGHIRVPKDANFDASLGVCSYHEDCLEGLASGVAIHKRYGIKAEQLEDEVAWQQEARYLAYGMVRKEVADCINGYFELPELEDYIVHASSDTIGVLGAIKLASIS